MDKVNIRFPHVTLEGTPTRPGRLGRLRCAVSMIVHEGLEIVFGSRIAHTTTASKRYAMEPVTASVVAGELAAGLGAEVVAAGAGEAVAAGAAGVGEGAASIGGGVGEAAAGGIGEAGAGASSEGGMLKNLQGMQFGGGGKSNNKDYGALFRSLGSEMSEKPGSDITYQS